MSKPDELTNGELIDHNKVSRVWREGGPRIQNVKIKTLYDPSTRLVVLQFEDNLGPVFRATFNVPALRKLLDDVNDSLLEIDLDEAEKARVKDEKNNN